VRHRRSLKLAVPAAVLVAVTAFGSGAAGSIEVVAPPPATTTATHAAGAVSRHIRLQKIGRFDAPVYVTGAPGDRRRLFVVEQAGAIRVVRGGRTLAQPFLDIRSRVTSGGEQGLLSVAFAPDYARSGRFYVYYTDRAQQQRVVEYHRAGPDHADPGSARLVLEMADHEANHNGGSLVFGPDGLLYIGTGDGGGAGDQHGSIGNAQDLTSLLGKLLRIDPRRTGTRPYSVPGANPFAHRAHGVRREIYSYGLRNPWRFSFDRTTAALTIGDVGQDTIEEIDHVHAGAGRGANFGWRPFEGTDHLYPRERVPGAVRPVLQFTHSAGYCSITGGYVVRDRLVPRLYGRYVYGDFCDGHLRAAHLTDSGAVGDHRLSLPAVPALSSFGQDTAGRVYVVSLNGPVYRLAS